LALTNSKSFRGPPRPSPAVAVRTYATIIPSFGLSVNDPLNRVCSFCNVDRLLVLRYNLGMTKRTARKDSNYVIYAATHDGSSYIGLTRKGSVTVARAVKERWRKHISRAKHEDRAWVLYQYIKQGNWTDWTHEVICVIRGRAEAYAYERELVRLMAPELNDQYL